MSVLARFADSTRRLGDPIAPRWKDDDKPAPKEVEKGEKSNPRHDPEDGRPGGNDSGYGAHRNSGDEMGTTDHDPGLDS